MFDLEAFKRWDRQVDHGNDEIVEGAILEIERLREGLRRIVKSSDHGEAAFLAAVVLGGTGMVVSTHEDKEGHG